jgi:folate-binding protein YgfZ
MATASPFTPETLQNRSVTALVGDGILAFLHNILTCDLENLIQGEIAYGALLSPQGKILHDMFVHHAGSSVLLDCEAEQREALIAKLKLYRLRAKFEIVPREDLGVVVGGKGTADPRHAGLGARRILPLGNAKPGDSYDTRRYALGIADSAEIGSGKLFPHEANFDQFGGVDFKKGCYIGQEVVSRMQHRSTARSRILPLMFADDQYAAEIRVNEVALGEVLGRRGKQALALVRLDRLEVLSPPLPFIVVKPDWATFEVKLP